MSGVLHGVIASLKAAAAAVTDTYWKYVSLLLNTTSTNGAQNNTFLDSSTNNFTVTRNGDTTQGSFTPYMPSGYWSGYFDGTGDYITTPNNTAVDLSTGDFTLECWVFPTSSTAGVVLGKGTAGTYDGYFLYQVSGTSIQFLASTNGTSWNITLTASTVYSLNTWNHVAVSRNGSTFKLFVNGNDLNTVTNAGTFITNTSTFSIGQGSSGTTGFGGGYISNARIVKGTAVYTGAFTPPTTPLTAITNTSLLCLQDNRFKDNSTNAFALTRNGDTRISKFAPFNPPASWDAATYGGSGYFDGTGDYLGIADSTAFDLNSTFTVECWFYQPAAGDGCFFVRGGGNASWSATNGHEYLLFVQTGVIYWMWNNAGANTQISTTAPATGQWHHIAVGYNGTTTRMWVNGVSAGTSTVAYTLPTTRNITRVGISPDGTVPLTGYVSNLRVVKGTDVYGVGNTTITVPTAPLTAITNTSLLLNFTNAGIYDAATINDAQTSSNAQASTTVAKFGTTSMKFAGGSDWLQMVSKPELRFGTAPFTIEAWLYPTLANTMCAVSVYTGTQGWTLKIAANTIAWYDNTSGNIAGTAAVASNTWTHVAIVREGTGTNQFKFYVNGVLDVTSTCSANFNQTANCFVGGEGGSTPNFATSVWNGYIQDLRITNGYARYTANFTPPTSAFPTS